MSEIIKKSRTNIRIDMRKILSTIILLFLALSVNADNVSIRMNRVRHPVTKKWGYAFKEQNVNSPLHGVIATGVNWVGFGSQLISKKESELIDWVIPPHYDEVAPKFLDGLSMVRLGDKVGFINMYDCFVIKPEYDFTGDLDGFHEGLAAVRKNGKWGYINHHGVYMIQAEYDDADAFNDNHLAAVKKDGRWGVIDLNGTVVVPLDNKMKQAMMNVPLSNKAYRAAVAKAKKDYEAGAYSERISQIENTKPARRAALSASKSTSAASKKKGKKGGKSASNAKSKASANNAESKRPESASLDAVHERLKYTNVGSGDSLGVKDQYGRWIVPPLFSSIRHDNDDDMFIVKRGDYYGCYLWNGNRLIGTYFDSMGEFSGGKAKVTAYGVTGWIDKNGYLNNTFISDLCKAATKVEESNTDKARGMYERCIEISPDYASAYNNLALLDFRNKDYNKGIKKLKLAAKLEPGNTTIAKNLEQAKSERKLRRQKRWDAGLDVAIALVTLGVTAYSTYSSVSNQIKGNTGYATTASVANVSGSMSSMSSMGSYDTGGSGDDYETIETECVYCHGSGICWACDGSGQGPKTITGTDKHEKCHYCHGKKVCSKCKGKKTSGSKRKRSSSSNSNTVTSDQVHGTCRDCGGDGICPKCNGRRVVEVAGTPTTCWSCNGDGKCHSCNGGKR